MHTQQKIPRPDESGSDRPPEQPQLDGITLTENDVRLLRASTEAKRARRIINAVANQMEQSCEKAPHGYKEAVIGFLIKHNHKAAGFIEGYVQGERIRCKGLLREFHDAALQACGATENLFKTTRLSLERFHFITGNVPVREVGRRKTWNDDADRRAA